MKMPMAPQSLYSQLYGKEAENRRVLSLVLNVRRHCKDVTSDGKLFQVLDATFCITNPKQIKASGA